MGNWNTSSKDDDDDKAGGSAGDFDDSYNDAMGYDSGFDDGDTGDTGSDDNYYSSDTYSGTFEPEPDTGGDDATTTGSFLDDDNDGVPNYLDADTAAPVDYGYDYPTTTTPTTVDYDYFTPTPTTETYGQPTSFANIYDPFAGGDYTLPDPQSGDSDGDGIPDNLDSDTATPYSPYKTWQALPETSFQKQLLKDPQQAFKQFAGAKSKKIDTLKDGSEVYTVTYAQKSPVTGETIDRSMVYTTGPGGQTVKDLYNVTDENSLGDALGNALGFAVPIAIGIPGRVSTDTKVMNKYTTQSELYGKADVSPQYYSTSAVTAFEKELDRTTTIETAAEREARLAREEAERQSGRDDGDSVVRLATTPSTTVDDAYKPPSDYEEYFKKFMGSAATYVSPYDVLRGRAPVQTAAVGGEIDAPDDYLTINAEYVREMPDAFMRNPAMARSPEEVRAIFAHNRRVQNIARGPQMMNQGGVAVTGESGPILENPENVTEAESVADNVEKTVPEGTFIINQPAAELMGTKDVKEMLLGAVKELRKQGVDFSFGEGKIPEEDAVSLLVSKGEIMVHPLLAKVIGIDRLNKINNRGQAEVEKRIKENGQSPQAEQAQAVV
jgi:hypothetical protein